MLMSYHSFCLCLYFNFIFGVTFVVYSVLGGQNFPLVFKGTILLSLTSFVFVENSAVSFVAFSMCLSLIAYEIYFCFLPVLL